MQVACHEVSGSDRMPKEFDFCKQITDRYVIKLLVEDIWVAFSVLRLAFEIIFFDGMLSCGSSFSS